MGARIEWTTPEQRRLIIDEALGLLERHGMRFGRGVALEALAQAGARVDRETGVARIPSALVAVRVSSCWAERRPSTTA
jgi:trimethylamine:corrinoid methyltransferase-like protein